MILIIGVRFRKSGKVYYFAPNGLDIKKGDHVIVETARGIEYGLVVLGQKYTLSLHDALPILEERRVGKECMTSSMAVSDFPTPESPRISIPSP